ncbi:hypothetical protein RKD26_003101 [Streptomyces calvus]
MESSTVGSATSTCWKRRSSAGSFSMRSRYSSSVVAPTMRSSPRASIGLSMLPASIAESPPAPAPTTVCSSSMKVMICPSESLISARTVFRRSSNSPRYLAPATMAPRSSATSRLFFSDSGTSPLTIRWASPSTTAVLPTPGSPMRTGLFLVRRDSTWTTRRISWSRPMTGSSLPSRAAAVKSVPNFSRALYWPSGSAVVTRRAPLVFWKASCSFFAVAPCPDSTSPAAPPLAAMPMRRCSVERYSSPRSRARAWASAMTASSSRLGCGGATVDPVTLGRPARTRSAPERTAALVGVDRGEQVRDVLVLLALEQGEQQVGRGEVGVPVGHGAVAGGAQRVPAPVGQLGVHVRVLLLGDPSSGLRRRLSVPTRCRLSLLTRPTYTNLSLFHSR